MGGRILAGIEILRPHNMVVAAGSVWAGYLLAGGEGAERVALPLVFTALVTGGGNLINDYFDADIDRLNKPRRPIPSGRLSRSFVLGMYLALTAALSLLFWLLLPVSLALVMSLWETLIFLYGYRGKKLPGLGSLIVAVVAASAFVAGAMVAGRPERSLFPFVFALVFVLARELVKGAEDYDGDLIQGASTVATRLGVEGATRIAAAMMTFCVLIAPLPTLAGYYSFAYFFVMEAVLVPGLLHCALTVVNAPVKPVLTRASWLLKGEMVVGVVAMALAGI